MALPPKPADQTPAVELLETGGPTRLALGAVADGEYLLRSGNTIVGGAGGGGGGAPTTAQYVTLATNASLTAERVLTAGSGISITDAGAGSTVTIAATGTGPNSATVDVDFGASFTHYAEKVVTGATWVASGSEIVATLRPSAGDEIDALLHGFSVAVTDLVVGDGFTLRVFAAVEAKGVYPFSVVGV